MKKLIAYAYRRVRQRIDQRVDRVVNDEDIFRYGDHYIYGKLLTNDSVVIDLGANRGNFAKPVEQAFHSCIYLVEANRDLLDAIDISGSIKINAAIASSNSPMIFYVSANSEASSLNKNMASQYGIIEERPVECVTFSTLLSRYNIGKIDLLKIDIEGAEIDLLLSMNDEEIQGCKQIAIEFHDFMLPNTSPAVESLVQRLNKLDFLVLKFSPLDWRRVLFIHKSIFPAPSSFLRRFRSVTRSSRLLDLLYYKVILPCHSRLAGGNRIIL
jgi:FkbM family methyltransferase